MEAQYKVFVKRQDTVPDGDIANLVTTEATKADALRRAGLDALADHRQYLGSIADVRCMYMELDSRAYLRYTGYFSVVTTPEKLMVEPPDGVTAYLIVARESNKFTSIELRSRPATGESIAIGIIRNGTYGEQRFLIAQWGEHLTGLRTLRLKYWMKRVNQTVPESVELSAIIAIGVGALWLSWHNLLATIVTATLAWLAVYVSIKRKTYSCRITSAIIVAILATLSTAYCWQTADRVIETTVCSGHHDGNFQPTWRINTTDGDMTVDQGYYGGKYYTYATLDQAAKSLVGQHVRLTIHGHVSAPGSKAPYITVGDILGTGNCGH